MRRTPGVLNKLGMTEVHVIRYMLCRPLEFRSVDIAPIGESGCFWSCNIPWEAFYRRRSNPSREVLSEDSGDGRSLAVGVRCRRRRLTGRERPKYVKPGVWKILQEVWVTEGMSPDAHGTSRVPWWKNFLDDSGTRSCPDEDNLDTGETGVGGSAALPLKNWVDDIRGCRGEDLNPPALGGKEHKKREHNCEGADKAQPC